MPDSCACFPRIENQDDARQTDGERLTRLNPSTTVCHVTCAGKITEVFWKLQKCFFGVQYFRVGLEKQVEALPRVPKRNAATENTTYETAIQMIPD
jgi:hypothetical protein